MNSSYIPGECPPAASAVATPPVPTLPSSGNAHLAVGGLPVSDDNPVPVKVVEGGGSSSAVGAINDAAAPPNGSGDYTVLSALKRVLLNGAALLSRIPSALVNGRFPVQVSELESTFINGKILIGGARDKWRDQFRQKDPLKWDYSTYLDASDFADVSGDTQGADYVDLSIGNNAGAAKRSLIVGKTAQSNPIRWGFGLAATQRLYGDMLAISSAAVDEDTGAIILAAGENNSGLRPSVSISKIVIASNVAYIKFNADHGMKFDDYFVVSGSAETRLNALMRVTSVRNRHMITASFTFANGTYAVGNSCVANVIDPSFGAADCVGIMFTEATSSNAVYFHRSSGGPIMWSAQTSFGTSYSDPLIPVAQPYAKNAQPRFLTELVQQMDMVRWLTGSNDTTNAFGVSLKRTQSVPDVGQKYTIQIGAARLPNAPRYIPIQTASKAGSTTATVTLEEDIGYPNGTTIYVRSYGQFDQTNWANVTTDTVATVTGARTLTFVWGASVTATVSGGVLVIPNQSAAATAVFAERVIGASWYGGKLYVGTSAAPAVNVGDIIRLPGCYDSANAKRNDLDRRYRVIAVGANVNIQDDGIGAGSTTSGNAVIGLTNTAAVPVGAILAGTGVGAASRVQAVSPGVSVTGTVNSSATGSALYDIGIIGMVLEPVDGLPQADSQPANPITGGAIVRETTFRVHFARCLDYTRLPVEIVGAHGHDDQQMSLPAKVLNTVAANISQIGGAAIQAAISNGSTNRATGVTVSTAVVQTDVSAGAFNGAGRVNGTVIASAQGGGAVISAEISVSALTLGTASSVLAVLQESTGGTNFTDIWVSDPITATGVVRVPAIPVAGRRRWTFHSVGGTSTTVTATITTHEMPPGTYPLLRQFRDVYSAANPFATVINNAATAASNFVLISAGSRTSIFNVEGCKAMTAYMVLTGAPTVTTQPSVKVRGSMDGNNWVDIPGATMTAAGAGMYAASIANAAFKYMAMEVATAAVYSSGNYAISSIGINGVN